MPEDAKSLLAKHIFLNSSGDVQGEEYFGTPTETAFLALGVGLGGDFQAVTGEPGLETLQFVPFNSTRKRMGAVVKLPSGKIFILWKGAAEMVLDGCTHALDPQGKVWLALQYCMTTLHYSTALQYCITTLHCSTALQYCITTLHYSTGEGGRDGSGLLQARPRPSREGMIRGLRVQGSGFSV